MHYSAHIHSNKVAIATAQCRYQFSHWIWKSWKCKQRWYSILSGLTAWWRSDLLVIFSRSIRESLVKFIDMHWKHSSARRHQFIYFEHVLYGTRSISLSFSILSFFARYSFNMKTHYWVFIVAELISLQYNVRYKQQSSARSLFLFSVSSRSHFHWWSQTMQLHAISRLLDVVQQRCMFVWCIIFRCQKNTHTFTRTFDWIIVIEIKLFSDGSNKGEKWFDSVKKSEMLF